MMVPVAVIMACFMTGVLAMNHTETEGSGEDCMDALQERNDKIARVVAAGRGHCDLDPNDELNLRVKHHCPPALDVSPCAYMQVSEGAPLEDGNTPLERNKRLVSTTNTWNKGIVPYVITGGDRASIHRAMGIYSRRTCIQFVPWYSGIENDLGLDHRAYLNFVASGGCWAISGRTSPGQQISCCGGDVCIHELGHALGAYHEQGNPMGQPIISIQPDNVQDGKRHNFEMQDLEGKLSTGYDHNSIMHYDNHAFSNGKGDTIKSLVSDLPSGDEYYYLMQELSLSHRCAETYCSNLTLECTNDGYKTLVDGQCGCMCPEGLDPATGCATVLGAPDTKAVGASSWPTGSYALPTPATGCPGEQFTSGSVVASGSPPAQCTDSGPQPHGCAIWVKGNGCQKNPTQMYRDCAKTCGRCFTYGSHTSNPSYLAGTTNKDGVEHAFCTSSSSSATDDSGGDATWPAGEYCIYRKGGACPEGFNPGSATFTDELHSSVVNSVSGSLADGDFGNSSTKLEFCCHKHRQQGPMTLPPTRAFSLLRRGTCPDVIGMHLYTGFKVIRSLVDPVLSGTHPVNKVEKFPVGKQLWRIYDCNYIPTKRDCGGVIQLTKANPTATFSGGRGRDLVCDWLVKVPLGDRVSLNFNSLNVGHGDVIDLKYMRLAQPGQRISGSRYGKTTTSIYNTMFLSYETFDVGTSGFEATVSLISASDLCYNSADNGNTYSGNVSITKGLRTCVPWGEVGHCEHNPYQAHYIDAGLDNNYCRNPHTKDGLSPWCYYEAAGCKRDYCDVCRTDKVYDVTPTARCELLKTTGYCDDDVTAQRECALTCGDRLPQFDVPPPAVTVTCPAPGDVMDGDLVGELKSSYAVGDTVTYRCRASTSTRDRKCLTSGAWSSRNFVCTECDEGGKVFQGNCYHLHKAQVKWPQAVASCQAEGRELATSRTAEENRFLNRLATKGTWLAADDKTTEGAWRWRGGEALSYTNWKWNEPDNWYNEDCLYMNNKGAWEDQWCTNEWKPYVCVTATNAKTPCVDATDTCMNLYENNPDVCRTEATFMAHQCPVTCGQCQPTPCPVDPATDDAQVVDDVPVIVQGGKVTYRCLDGADYVAGDYVRGCRADGSLTGSPLVCLMAEVTNEVTMDHLPLISDRFGSKYKVNHAYVIDSPYSRVPVSGRIVRWEYYSANAGTNSFQVWRKTDKKTRYEFVGQNVVATPPDLSTSYSVPQDHQIHVKAGDVLGIYYGSPMGGVKYKQCSGRKNPAFKFTYKMTTTYTDPTGLTAGDMKDFKHEGRQRCRMYTFTAVIVEE